MKKQRNNQILTILKSDIRDTQRELTSLVITRLCVFILSMSVLLWYISSVKLTGFQVLATCIALVAMVMSMNSLLTKGLDLYHELNSLLWDWDIKVAKQKHRK